MKLFKSSILALLGVAVALTSCSDDNKYVAGTNSPGAYFLQNAGTTYFISSEASSFDVLVYRTEDAPLTYNLSSVDASGLFTIPTSVTFNEDELTSKITIAYNPENLQEAVPYEITLTVGQESDYAYNSVNITVSMQAPYITQPFGNTGYGDYTYNAFFSGVDPGLPITISYLPATPNDVFWTIGDWGYGIDLQITCTDMTDVDASGDVTVHVPGQYIGYNHDTYGEVWVADEYSFLMMLKEQGYNIPQEDLDAVEYNSYYNDDKGLFTLWMLYYVPKYGSGTSYFAPAYETFQMYGYPDYTVEVTYDGLFIDREQTMTAKATIECGADVATVRTVMVEGKDAQVGIDAILSEAADVQTIPYAGDAITAEYPLTKDGEYTIVAITYDVAGEEQQFGSDTFVVTLGASDDSADWTDYGVADYVDGWIIQNFAVGGAPIVPLEWAYPVLVQQNIAGPDPNGLLYRLVQPYGEDYPAAALNDFPANRNINFYIDDIYAGIIPQLSGFGLTSWGGELTIGTLEGLYMEDGSYTLGEVAPLLLQTSNAPNVSSYEDNVISIPLPLFGAPGVGDGSFGYSWTTKYTAMIIMPDAPAGVRAKVKAASVAAPKFQGAVSGAKAVKVTSRKTLEKLPIDYKNHKPRHATLRRR